MGALLSAALLTTHAAPCGVPGPAGAQLIVESNHTVPLVHVVVASRSGSAADPRHREGLTNLAAEWARHGAGGKSREQLDAALDALGATLEVETQPDSTRFEGEVLARNLDAYLALLADVIVRPNFAPAELQRTRRELLAGIDEAPQRRSRAGRALLRAQPLRRPSLRAPARRFEGRAGGGQARRDRRAFSPPLRRQEPGVCVRAATSSPTRWRPR